MPLFTQFKTAALNHNPLLPRSPGTLTPLTSLTPASHQDIYEEELRAAQVDHDRQRRVDQQHHADQLNRQLLLAQDESMAAQDAIAALKQQHRVEISHFNDIVDELQTIDVDCVHQKLQLVHQKL